MLRHIAWFNEAPIEPSTEGRLTSSDVTVVRRCLLPAVALEELGVECSVFGNMQNANPMQVALHLQKLDTDIVVIGALSCPSALTLARMVKHCGCLLVVDFARKKELGVEETELAELADQLIVASDEGALLLESQLKLSAQVIPDCDEETGCAPTPRDIMHIWFKTFQSLKLKPPICANMNEPTAG